MACGCGGSKSANQNIQYEVRPKDGSPAFRVDSLQQAQSEVRKAGGTYRAVAK